MLNQIRRIAISAGGGDAPGLNAVIRAAVISGIRRGWECYGIRDSFNGILFPQHYSDEGVVRLTVDKVRGIAHLGGTILGTTNQGDPLHFPKRMPDGTITYSDRTDEIVTFFEKQGLDALIAVGGDGTLTIANALHRKGLSVVGASSSCFRAPRA